MNKKKGRDPTPIHSVLPGLPQYNIVNSTNGDQICRAFGHVHLRVLVASAWGKLIDGHSQVANPVFFSLGVCENNSSLFFLSLGRSPTCSNAKDYFTGYARFYGNSIIFWIKIGWIQSERVLRFYPLA